MNNTTKIIFIRHGESLGNANKTFLGHTDLDLSELGYKQAEATAKHLKDEKIDVIYSSDLIRARNTAIPNAKIRDLDINFSEKLREMYVGDWENQTFDQIIEKWGSEVFFDEWKNKFGTFRFPNGESIEEGGTRFYNEVLSIIKQNEGKIILIAAHAAVIRAFWGIISDIPWENLAETFNFPSNASYSVAIYDGKKIIPVSYSNDEHLKDIGVTQCH